MCPGTPPTLVGCVAVSMAQIMYYWKYPDAAIGGYQSYNDYQGTFSGTVSTTFGTPYNWYNMENTGAGEDTQRLLFESQELPKYTQHSSSLPEKPFAHVP